MKSILILTILISSCGKIKVDDVEIKDSTHTVYHRVVLDADLGEANTICVEQYPEDVIKQQECLDGYQAVIDAIAGIDQNVLTDVLDL